MALASHVVEIEGYVDAFEQAVRSLLSVADDLDADDWRRPTDLPGWSVQDIVAHLASVEAELLSGEPPPPLASFGPHVRSDFGRHMERGVAARRGAVPGEVVDELRMSRPTAATDAGHADRPAADPVVADEDWDTTELLRNRAFDAWMHEQDVRRAVTRPGNLDGPGALVTKEMLLEHCPCWSPAGPVRSPGRACACSRRAPCFRRRRRGRPGRSGRGPARRWRSRPRW
jgi:uncharacterized protein (TIGR03083 family)